MTTQEEIEKVHGGGTHVVILGAGASFAATLRNPEKNKQHLPLMWNIVDIVGLNDVVDALPEEYKKLRNNFEKLYSNLYNDKRFVEERGFIERGIYDYFNQLELPDEPTIYDYLVLSLRNNKDLIATFNWDPFLYKAFIRNNKFVKGPGINFLHGNVAIGYDEENKISGPANWSSNEFRKKFEPTQLLYPVEKKDYNSDEYIAGQWESLSDYLKIAQRVTVFGYSAPVTDVEAIDLLKNAWGDVEDRAMEEFEVIDIRDEEEVVKAWDKFIHTHHYHYCKDYFESSLAWHPRRSVESYRHWAMPLSPNEAFQDGNKIREDFKTLEELWEWHLPLIEAEKRFYES